MKNFKLKIDQINLYLETILPDLPEYSNVLHESMKYSLLAGGKRLRPLLMITTYETFQKPSDTVFPFAVAIELIHTYSLIHDDLPCMDNDELRRGKPTNHIVFGENVALLAGDALLTQAFEIISDPKHPSHFKTESLLQVIHCLSKQIGMQGMIGGQFVDINNDHLQKDEVILDFIHQNKTSALIIAAVQIGGILAEIDSNSLNALISFAKNIGTCFQIQDDILDETANIDSLGKTIGSDKKNQKLTYPSFHGLEASKKLAEKTYYKAISYLKKINQDTSMLEELANFIIQRNY